MEFVAAVVPVAPAARRFGWALLEVLMGLVAVVVVPPVVVAIIVGLGWCLVWAARLISSTVPLGVLGVGLGTLFFGFCTYALVRENR